MDQDICIMTHIKRNSFIKDNDDCTRNYSTIKHVLSFVPVIVVTVSICVTDLTSSTANSGTYGQKNIKNVDLKEMNIQIHITLTRKMLQTHTALW